MTRNNTTLEAPRFENRDAITFAGLSQQFDMREPEGIPKLWERFGQFIGNVPGQVERVTYGVSHNFDGANHFEYLCAVEITGNQEFPEDFVTLTVPAQRYAVFSSREHISQIRSFLTAIWRDWMPQSGLKAASGPMFERYGPEYDAATGMGGFEVWVPLDR